ncbi:MAG: hypothetical protein KJI72_00250 [Patescibacteria group bacterium]|nr:hypothetical protein [Patescibacteria group bacterium]
MALVLKINTIDRNDHIAWDTLTKSERLTKEPDILQFNIRETPSKTIPALGDSVELLEDAVKIFGGIITERLENVIGGRLIGYKIRCKDHHHTLDKELVVKSYENQTARAIILDIITTFTDGSFTTANVPTSTPTIGSIKFNYEPVSKAIQKIADLINWDWYVDYDKDINFFDDQTNTAPFDVEDSNDKIEWPTLKLERNIHELKNSIIVRGGKYKSTIAEADAVDKYDADGLQRTFPLVYRYSNISVKVAGAAKTVGTDFLSDPLAFDCLYNFQEKLIKFRENNKPAVGDDVVVFGDSHIPLIAKVRDQISVSTYGEYQHIIVKKNIISITEAQQLAKSELRRWSDGLYEVRFRTTETGLKTGQQIRINSTIRGIDKKFKINGITGKARGSDHMEYQAFLLASGDVTFTDMMVGLLGKDRENIDVADDEVLQRLEIFPETINIGELVTTIKKSPPYTWGVGGSNDFKWNFATWA